MFIFYLVALIIIISVQTDFITERSILGTSIIFTSRQRSQKACIWIMHNQNV